MNRLKPGAVTHISNAGGSNTNWKKNTSGAVSRSIPNFNNELLMGFGVVSQLSSDHVLSR
jgi:hypothetical protein